MEYEVKHFIREHFSYESSISSSDDSIEVRVKIVFAD